MFTDGVRVRQEVGGAKRREAFKPISIHERRIDPIVNQIKGAYNSGVLPPTKFDIEHLSGVIPASQPTSVTSINGRSGSDMDTSSDSEDEVYGGQYSLKSSPQDDKIPTSVAPVYNASRQRDVNHYKDEINFSRKSTPEKQGKGEDRLGREDYGVQLGQPGASEDEQSDSATSTEMSSTQCRSNSTATRRETYTSDGYSSNIRLQANVETRVEQDLCVRRMRDENNYKDLPSAPPFIGSGPKIEPTIEKVSTSRASGTPYLADYTSFATTCKAETSKSIYVGISEQDGHGHGITSDSSVRTAEADCVNANVSTGPVPARLPTFHASGQGPWCAVISYDACVRLCLHSWAKGCVEEAPHFLNNECTVLRNAFGLQHVLIQSEDELLAKRTSEFFSEGVAPKSKKVYGKMKVQVRKVKMGLEPPPGCNLSSLGPQKIKLEALQHRLSNLNLTLYSGWKAVQKVRVTPRVPANRSFSQHSLAYMHASAEYVKEVSRLLRNGVSNLHNSSSSYEAVQETYGCLLRLKSSAEEDVVRMQPGSSETHVFFPDGHGDDLIIEVQDLKGRSYGRVLAQVAAITDDPGEKLRWWPIYHEPEHELVGRIQLHISYTTCADEHNQPKCGQVAETVAYDLVLEVAMKVLHFQQRNLLLHGPWRWLVTEFASYYGVSDAYTKLRYLSYVMDVATPTKDCLDLVNDLLLPVLMKGNSKNVLSHQENRILGEVDDQIQQILVLVFENYKSLDESSLSGMMDTFRPATGLAAPVLASAVKLYSLLHDILSPEAQLKFCRYFQAAAKKRSRRHLTETDEFIQRVNESTLDPVTFSISYQKMKSVVLSMRNEIFTDIQIQNNHLFPSFLDLPNLSASIYSVELCNRLRKFLVSCTPPCPSPPVVDLVIATADFQRDLVGWNINPIKAGVDAKELFHVYITRWVQDKRATLLESCKLDKVKWPVTEQHSTTPFVDDMYDQLTETLNEYEIIICRWPEYAVVLEHAVADVERAIVEALDRHYADVLSPLNLAPKIPGLKYVQKFAKRTVNTYLVPDELGIFLNSLKRLLDVLRPKIEAQLKSWSSCIPDGGNTVTGECLSEITVMLRAKFRSYVQAVGEKLADNTKIQGATKLKKIIEDFKENVLESDVRSRMQPLRELLIQTINQVHTVFEPHLFTAICRGFWDRMGQEMLKFLENRRENKLWYKGSRITLSILDDTFASQMQQLLGNALQDKDLEPPRSIMEARSMLCKDAVNYKESNYYY
ncbi:hypothetical protein HS088_TW03G00069 [Tripterygium wilfordii]|uniref:Pesticidal crystal cry8Ba protein n=1 Tax=Tripterygium wilfordii TaxID=458696 RepID=A0A7J7DUA9_TRIWF|nr:uncharacterized protein LOC119995342 isoform X2 [Tripterygium wilfordii]KAF5749744.1 hypothetical protein HS088_TW03G00069 [Tripterygium wilfordii]